MTTKTVPDNKKLREYETGPQKILLAMKGLTVKQLAYKTTPQEWTINQIIVHLADADMIFCERMKKIIVEEKPLLQSFDQNDWAKRLFYDKQNCHFALGLLIAQRNTTLQLLRTLPHRYWKREGIRDGEVFTLYDIFLTAVDHLSAHEQEINTIKSSRHFPR